MACYKGIKGGADVGGAAGAEAREGAVIGAVFLFTRQ